MKFELTPGEFVKLYVALTEQLVHDNCCDEVCNVYNRMSALLEETLASHQKTHEQTLSLSDEEKYAKWFATQDKKIADLNNKKAELLIEQNKLANKFNEHEDKHVHNILNVVDKSPAKKPRKR